MFSLKEIKKSLIVAAWFMFLTFPIMVIKVNTIDNFVEWRWINLVIIGFGSFFLSFIWRYLLKRKYLKSQKEKVEQENSKKDKQLFITKILKRPKMRRNLLIASGVLIVLFPFISTMYQTNIMITALIYVMLGLGLNIVVGLAGLLVLGYVAFSAVGAYTYALLNFHFGIDFWIALPMGAFLATIFGIILGFPVLRLRGDYLAIVTLAFGEIVRLVLENWNGLSFGPSGIANIPKPTVFGLNLSLTSATIFIYYLSVILVIFTIFVINRLKNSRVGRTWIALREDEVASQAMGINRTKTKLTAFALAATWAGIAGVMFAAKTTFINPASFTLWESVLILCMVVLGGLGSIPGVVVGALVLVLMPEYLRAFSEYRLLIFGAILVLMMIFRPEGIIKGKRVAYKFKLKEK